MGEMRNIYGEGIKIAILRNICLPFTKKIVFWKKNLSLLPSEKAGRKLFEEVSRLMNEWLLDLQLKDIPFKVIMIMPNLLLQKPSQK